MSDLKDIERRLAERAKAKDEAGVHRLAERYYKEEGALILPAELEFAAASCSVKAADYARAASHYRRFLRFYGDHARADEARYRLGVLYGRWLNDPAEARRHLSLVVERGSSEAAGKAARALEKLSTKPSSKKPEASTGRCVVVLQNERPVNVSAVGREVAGIVGKRLVDVTRDIKASHVVLAVDVDRMVGERIVGALAAMGVPARSIPDGDFPPVPIPEIVTRASLTEHGYALNIRETMVTGKHADLRLIVAARMQVHGSDLVKRKWGGDTMGGYAGIRVFSPGSEKRTVRETRTTEYGVIDLFPSDSPRRLRLDERHLELADDDERAVNKRLNLRLYGEQLAVFARDVPSNDALHLYVGKRLASTPWDDFTFDTDRAFDLYCSWLLAMRS